MNDTGTFDPLRGKIGGRRSRLTKDGASLGDLRDNGYTLTLHCTAIRCLRPLDVDLARMIELFGADTVYVAKRWPVRCARCGCRQISMTLGQNAPKIRIMPPVGG